MILSSLATPFVVPPVNLAVLALFAAWRRRRRLAAGALVALLLLALPVVSGGLMRGLQAGIPPVEFGGAQAILVLGGDLDRDRDGVAVPGAMTLERLREGAMLSRRSGLPLAVTGGPAWLGGPAVGAVMAQSLRQDFGVPVRWVETSSDDTWENARNSNALLAPAGIRQVLVVTHAWHMRRSLLAFRRSGLVARPAAVWRIGYPGLSSAAAAGSLAGELVPRVGAWQQSYLALHEWIGIVWYWLRDLV